MAGGLNKLTARGVVSHSAKGRYADGGGLYLQVDANGGKQWIFRFQVKADADAPLKRVEMGLGGVKKVSLAVARDLAAQHRATVAAGLNPLEMKRAAPARAQSDKLAKLGRSFEAVASAMLATKDAGWRNDKHRAQWRSTLATYAAPLSAMDVGDVKTEHVLSCLQPIWTTKPETAARLRGRIEAVLNAARARGLTPEDRANPARWRGHLDHLLPKRSKLSRGHHPALPWRDLPGFVLRLREREAVAARALEFIILTAARSGEVRGMTWDEVDASQAVWVVPAERMKATKEHRVPLSRSALAVLKMAGEPQPGAFVFPNDKGRAMSDMVFKALFDRMSATGVTAHGFRSSFRDWAGDATNFAREDIEAALAHTIGNKAEAAYRRGDAIDKRRRIMEAWADHCEPAVQGRHADATVKT